MFRKWFLVWLFAAGVLLVAGDVWAQSSWPSYPLGGDNQHSIDRGPGGYFSLIKLGLVYLVYLIWVSTVEWVNRDCQTLGLPYAVWNPVIFGPFLVGLVFAVTIPMFAVGYSVLVATWLIPSIIYVLKRNSVVELHERVLTPSHLRYVMAHGLKGVGVKMSTEAKAKHEKGAPVKFNALGGTNQQNQANAIGARQSPGYLNAKEMVAEMIRQRADKVMLDYSRDAVTVRFQIDGVWHESDSQDRETGDATLEVYKKLSNLNVDERRKRQMGRFTAEFEGKTYDCQLICQGTQTGERVIMTVDRPHSDFKSLRDLGMREKMEEKLKELLSSPHGMVIFSSAPAGGLSTTMGQALRLTDRYMHDFIAFQDVKAHEPTAENIEITTFDLSKGDKPEKLLESLLRREPNGVVVNELPNAAVAIMLCEHAANDKLVITTVRAKEGVEALLRVLLLKVPASKLAPAVVGVVNQRLIRRLCEECKQPYEPAPALMQKLGIPQGRVEHLFRPPDPSEQDKACPHCNGIGYFGRTSIFELLVINDAMRDVLQKQPKLEVLRQASRQAGNRSLQQEGIVLVAQGITSVQELSRVLKQ